MCPGNIWCRPSAPTNRRHRSCWPGMLFAPMRSGSRSLRRTSLVQWSRRGSIGQGCMESLWIGLEQGRNYHSDTVCRWCWLWRCRRRRRTGQKNRLRTRCRQWRFPRCCNWIQSRRLGRRRWWWHCIRRFGMSRPSMQCSSSPRWIRQHKNCLKDMAPVTKPWGSKIQQGMGWPQSNQQGSIGLRYRLLPRTTTHSHRSSRQDRLRRWCWRWRCMG